MRFTITTLCCGMILILTSQATAQQPLPAFEHRGGFSSAIESQGFVSHMTLHDRQLFVSSSEDVIEVFEQSGPDWVSSDFLLSPTPVISFALSQLAVNDRWLVIANPSVPSSTPGIITNVSMLNTELASYGAVMVFERVNDHWQFSAVLKSPSPTQNELFGQGVALNGDTIAVGSPGESGHSSRMDSTSDGVDLTRSGAVFVFEHQDGAWLSTSTLKAEFPDAQDLFGHQVLLEGNSLFVTAPAESGGSSGIDGDQSDNSVEQSGAVYEFRRIEGLWTQAHYLKASNPDRFDRFGDTVVRNAKTISKQGDLLVIGNGREQSASRDINMGQDDNSLFIAGAVYVFREQGDSWVQEAYLKPNNIDQNDHFGSSVQIDNGLILVGAFSEAGPGFGLDADPFENLFIGAGAAYRFEQIDNQWQQSAYIKSAEPTSGSNLPLFGSHVISLDNQLMLISAPNFGLIYPVDRPVSLSGQVSGMIPGTDLGLAFNTISSFDVSDNGPFTGPHTLPIGGQFDLRISAQPFDRICELVAFDPIVPLDGVNDIDIQCVPQQYTVSGMVDGLSGNTSLRLQNNGVDVIEVTQDGGFSFTHTLITDDGYDITVLEQPALQRCTVSNGLGLIDAGGVSNIEVNCGINALSLGGNLTDLTSGNFIEITSNSGNVLTLEVNGPFVFPNLLIEGTDYDVIITLPPQNFGQTCSVANGTGTVSNTDVMNVEITCTLPDALFEDGFEG